jgi:hypothetical protein
MKNKQTAVEFLMDNLHYLHSTKWNDILEQAKEMEKQKIIDLVDALKEIEAICDNQNSAHEHIWRVSYNAIKQFKQNENKKNS